MTGKRLTRNGVVRRAGDGCTTLKVSVPCSGCGRCPGAWAAGAGAVPVDELLGSVPPDGQPLQVSVSARGLTDVSVRLFVPAIAVALGYAVLAESLVVSPVAAGFALLLALLLGQRLARSGVAALDVSVAERGVASEVTRGVL
jgi:hypothetical protein